MPLHRSKVSLSLHRLANHNNPLPRQPHPNQRRCPETFVAQVRQRSAPDCSFLCGFLDRSKFSGRGKACSLAKFSSAACLPKAPASLRMAGSHGLRKRAVDGEGRVIDFWFPHKSALPRQPAPSIPAPLS